MIILSTILLLSLVALIQTNNCSCGSGGKKGMTKICCISDTHGYHKNLTIPKCDVLVHAGDFSSGRGSLEQIRKFNEWLGTLDAKHIVLIAGNHDFPLQDKAEDE